MAKKDLQKTKSVKEEKKKKEKRHGRGSPHKERVKKAQEILDTEQCLRESVIVRRIRGSIRSEKSLDRTAALLTCITTWKNHGLDPLEEIKKYIPMI